MVTLLAAVASLVLSSAFAIAEPSVSTPFLRRQLSPDISSSDVPSACIDVCQPLAQAFTGTCDQPSCFCTSAIASRYDDCLSCALKQNISSFTQADADAAVKAYTDACSDAGFPVDVSDDDGGSSANTRSAKPVKSGTATGTNAASTQTSTSDPISGGSSKSNSAVLSYSVSVVDSILITVVAGLAIM